MKTKKKASKKRKPVARKPRVKTETKVHMVLEEPQASLKDDVIARQAKRINDLEQEKLVLAAKADVMQTKLKDDERKRDVCLTQMADDLVAISSRLESMRNCFANLVESDL